jgi:hypothetical protein
MPMGVGEHCEGGKQPSTHARWARVLGSGPFAAPYWAEWFQGLSNKFLSVAGPKMLLLAGMDRLDKDLMIGQMQGPAPGPAGARPVAQPGLTGLALAVGKFQLQVIASAGHSVHEDAPGKRSMPFPHPARDRCCWPGPGGGSRPSARWAGCAGEASAVVAGFLKRFRLVK